MKLSTFLALTFAVLMSGCASVEMASSSESAEAKKFNPPAQGKAGLYIYRDSSIGAALKKDIWVNQKCLGESAAKVFFYTEVESGKKHAISTESEFSPNNFEVMVESGKNYFIRQFIKLGLFVGGAGLEEVPESKGRQDIARLQMAKPGKCSAPPAATNK